LYLQVFRTLFTTEKTNSQTIENGDDPTTDVTSTTTDLLAMTTTENPDTSEVIQETTLKEEET
jgi:hypothetical protein